MTKKELVEQLSCLPDDALVYVEADHGQCAEQAFKIYVFETGDKEWKAPHYGDELSWQTIPNAFDPINVKAICIA